ncbi:MAG: DNA translocase FtsK [Ruminococcaceae bacterium]|nr:DNA translocase FtsK [Oscillospiraceae bacterium]
MPCAALIGGLFGQLGRYVLPFVLVYTGIILFKSRGKSVRLRITSTLAIVLTLSAVVHLVTALFGSDDVGLSIAKLYSGGKTWQTGGLLPGLVANLISLALSKVGALIVFILLLALEVLYCSGMTVNGMINAVKNVPEPEREEKQGTKEERFVNRIVEKRQEHRSRKMSASDIDLPVDDPPVTKTKKEKKERPISPDEYIEKKRKEKDISAVDVEKQQVTIDEIELNEPMPIEKSVIAEKPITKPIEKPPVIVEKPIEKVDPISGMPELKPESEKLKRGEAEQQANVISEEIAKNTEAAPSEYVYPSVTLLSQNRGNAIDATGEMRENSKRLADALKSFGIEPHIVNVIRGPSITRYELELDPGVKLSRITNLSDDIALSLGATGVRISAIPDRISVVGIEVPNKAVNTVYARDVIDSAAFKNSKSRVSFAVGKDISGNCIVGDIAKLPHMLIAGTTGSGKSVCMNTLIISLLYKSRPDEVRLIMVDPKMVELGVYNGIPHLLIPVVTDPKKAAGALQWTVTEMMRRYRLMSEQGVRDLESYNKAIASDPDEQKLPQVVVVIDELADLMLVAAKEVEESICRIAQMGRASGIHLVIATQRPSADVITGLMKANIPSRIAFAVSSAMESRIILDTPGAEKLVGKGDMLFAPLGQGKPKRVQGCFINEDEVQAVVSSIKAQTTSDYSSEIMEHIEKRAEQSGKHASSNADSAQSASDRDGDELLPAAVEVILETGQASVSMLQRRLKLGYARAARIVDEMEEKGIVGPFEGAKPRQLLITKEQWEQMQNGTYDPNPPVEEEIP